jgi:hypothetical protein
MDWYIYICIDWSVLKKGRFVENLVNLERRKRCCSMFGLMYRENV